MLCPWACSSGTSFHRKSWSHLFCSGFCWKPTFDQLCAPISSQFHCEWLPLETFRRVPLGIGASVITWRAGSTWEFPPFSMASRQTLVWEYNSPVPLPGCVIYSWLWNDQARADILAGLPLLPSLSCFPHLTTLQVCPGNTSFRNPKWKFRYNLIHNSKVHQGGHFVTGTHWILSDWLI